MRKEFEDFKKALTECSFMDNENGHYEADIILKEIAITASNGLLANNQVVELIAIWDKVGKWYA